MLKTILILFVLVPNLASAALSQAQKFEDFDQLSKWVREDYGPLQFKEQTLGSNFAALGAEYRAQISPQMSDNEFYDLVIRYVAEFHDSHSKVLVPGDYAASLGFSVDLVQGKVLIDEVDRTMLSTTEFPYDRGDELIALDSVPVGKVTEDLKKRFGMGTDLPAKRVATFFLTRRSQKYLQVPTGVTEVTFKKHATGEVSTLSLKWVLKGTPYNGVPSASMKRNVPIGRGDLCSEKTFFELPKDAEIISDVPFTAFEVSTANGKIGFIRIPHYDPVDSVTGQEIAEARFHQYEKVIQKFEAETAGLVIDQNFNCGGSVLYLNKLVSLFARESFSPASLSFRASQTQVDGLRRQQLKMSPQVDGYERFKDLVDQIEIAKNSGLTMTPKLPVWGFLEVKLELPGREKISLNPSHYSKPILLLINELSGSGGDLFPAMMQDLGRATLMGHTTMGAGGHIWDDPALTLKNSGLDVSLTRSLIYRLNDSLIENAGVTPEIPYDVTEADFIGGNIPYFNAALEQLGHLIQATPRH